MSRPPIPVSRPSLGEAETARVAAALASGWVTQGPRVAEFEAAFAARVGARHGVAVASGTAGLHVALVAAGVGPGDEVVVPTMTFIATANAVVHAGARPVLCDVDRRTFNLRVSDVERVLSSRTRAILAVHQIGLPCDLDGLAALARDKGLVLVEDAACAIGASHGGRPIGRPDGRQVVFSFHPRKILTTGEGGMITLDDDAQAERLRRLRQHGMTASAHERHGATVPTERFDEVGWNYRMSDVHAAIGLGQLERLDGMLARRQAQARFYHQHLGSSDRLLVPEVPDGRIHAFQSYQVLLADATRRDETIARLAARGVTTRRGVACCHRQTPYADQAVPGRFPDAEWAWERSLLLPIFHDLTTEDQARVVEELLAALA